MWVKTATISFLVIAVLFSSGCVNVPEIPLVADCAKEGETFSRIYTDEYPAKCCAGLKEWESGMHTGISIQDECYDTGLLSGNPIGACINCGNGVCEQFEGVCSCPEDCVGKNRSEHLTVENFCFSKYWAGVMKKNCEERENQGAPDLPVCNLC